MEIVGYLAAIAIGVSLGLIGGGGSILTVPVLVYLVGIEPVLATAYSLFVVGISSFAGAISKWRLKLVCFKTALVFALPSFIAVYLTRLYLVPAIPTTIDLGLITFSKDAGIMVFFALIMFFAAFSMMKKKKEEVETGLVQKFNIPLIILEGSIVGVVTGLIGAGGGFLIIPALVLLARLPMKLAVGTSLAIIAVKSLFGFLGDVQGNTNIDWPFLLVFSAMAVVGIFIGNYLNKFISGEKLKKSFGWFVLLMALYILFKELV